MYREGDETGILSLLNLVFPDAQFNIERWLWEYKNNPFGHLEVVAEYNGQIVGHMGFVPVDMKIGDTVVKGSQAVDLAVHPNFRRQGMFLKLGRTLAKKAAEEGMPFTYGVPNETAYYGHLKYGWFDVCMIPVLISLSNRYNLIKRKIKETRKWDFSALSKGMWMWGHNLLFSILKYDRFEISAVENVKINEISSFDERVDVFWKNVSNDYGIITVRDRKYLNWRYFERPNTDYKAFLAEKDGSIEGYMILCTRTFNHEKEGYVVDVLASSEDIFKYLIRVAIEYFKKEKVAHTRCFMLNGHFGYKILKQSGFTRDYISHEWGWRLRLIARINSKQLWGSYISAAKKWYITIGDTDWR